MTSEKIDASNDPQNREKQEEPLQVLIRRRAGVNADTTSRTLATVRLAQRRESGWRAIARGSKSHLD